MSFLCSLGRYGGTTACLWKLITAVYKVNRQVKTRRVFGWVGDSPLRSPSVRHHKTQKHVGTARSNQAPQTTHNST